MNIDLRDLWRCFLRFQAGKTRTEEMEEFRYRLEEHLSALHTELSSGTYRHGPYRHFTVSDAKRRDIAVASVNDRLVHRLLYEYLETIYDPVFLHDAWSCRKGKGLHRAIDRAQNFLHRFRNGWFWRADIIKFFDHVDHAVLLNLLKRRVRDEQALSLLVEIVGSYARERERVTGRREFLLPCRRGLKFLGYEIFPKGRRLPKRTRNKILRCLNGANLSSYRGLVRSERSKKRLRLLDWHGMVCSQNLLDADAYSDIYCKT